MYIIIAGCGKVGAALALSLCQDNHNVVVIDSDPDNLSSLGSGFNGMTIVGMPIDEDVLKNADIEQADALAAVTDDDNMNIMVSQVAKELFHVPKIITHLYDPKRENVFRQMGMTTFCSTNLAVERIGQMLFPQHAEVKMNLCGTYCAMKLMKPERAMIGKTIAEYKRQNIAAMVRGNKMLTANANARIEQSDMLLVHHNGEEDTLI